MMFLSTWEEIEQPLFVKIVAILALLTTILLYLAYAVDRQGRKQLAAQREIYNIERYVSLINRRMQDLATDLKLVAHNPNLRDYLQDNKTTSLTRLTRQLSDFITAKNIYDQVRYIDETGLEKVRINLVAGLAKVATKKQLQNKKERYYFTDTMKLDEDQVFVSPFDLNIEFQHIEIPYKPTIRLATPVMDDKGKRRGIVILNYLGIDLIHRMQEAQNINEGFVELLSRDGYWLRSTHHELEWQFMFRKKINFQTIYPSTWKVIRSGMNGQEVIGDALWTWARIYPLSKSMLSSTGSPSPTGKSRSVLTSSDYYWIALSKTSTSLPAVIQYNLLQRYTGFWIASILAVVSLGWMIALREGRLKRSTKQAKLANQAKTQFLSSMSHELRTPLNAILGFSQVLEMGDGTTQLTQSEKGYINEIYKAGEHLLQLINEILDLATIESGQITLSIERVAIKDITRPCINMAMVMANENDIVVTDITDYKNMPLILADQTRMKQCLINLLSNAVKYNRHNGSVSLDCTVTGDGFVRFAVKDTGYGIPAKKHHKIFESFNRLGQEGSHIEGTGIGLVITRDLITRMNGRIGFESETDEGSTFWLDLPVAGKTDSNENLSNKPAQTSKNNTTRNSDMKKILYIEDNLPNIKLMEGVFDNMTGYTLRTASSAEAGLIAANEEKPDLILMDINLPGMNGIEACKIFKQQDETQHVPVIAVSADIMRYKKGDTLEASFDDFISKPIDVHEFIKLVDRFF